MDWVIDFPAVVRLCMWGGDDDEINCSWTEMSPFWNVSGLGWGFGLGRRLDLVYFTLVSKKGGGLSHWAIDCFGAFWW